ncbi:major facilitator super transporter protein [Coemansia brasiliensis]|uniref:GPI ethanolamine phosphate transferase 2 n=1 Tax=Coemansia brasiliensis TaxID=2650707 RepID=A0A9W8I6C8_9FUNG|nr:major facilitator super transporter protein [Coemansia brasiliensis]
MGAEHARIHGGRRFAWALALLLAVELLGMGLFARGFFPYKKSAGGFAMPADQPEDIGGSNRTQPEAQYDRLVLMVIDALRNDFIFGNESQMTYTQQLLRIGQARGFTARAQAPTVTMPRLKALMTGTVPGFLDAVLNIAEGDTSSSLQHQDSLLWQLREHGGKRINMFGDDTWLRLFPGLFANADGTSSFFVADTVEVDNNVTRHVQAEIAQGEWDVTVLHYLGLDHIGHLAGPRSALMGPKQREMDGVVKDIHEIVMAQDRDRMAAKDGARPTLMVVLGDHAMNELGNHGGNSQLETSTAFVFIGNNVNAQPLGDNSNALTSLLTDEVAQSNLAPTLALLLGVPIPKESLGVPLPQLLQSVPLPQRMHMLQTAAAQIYAVVRANEPAALPVSIAEVRDHPHAYVAADCHDQLLIGARLQCLYMAALAQHSLATNDDAERAYYAFMNAASTHLSQALDGYGLELMGAGIALLTVATLGLLWLCQQNGAPVVHIKARQLAVSVPAVVMWASQLLAEQSTSLVEEEHQLWYFWVQTLLALRAATSAGASGMLRSLMQMAVFRLIRAWNQTGQKWAGEPDIRGMLNAPSATPLLWTLAIAVALLVNFSCWALHRHFRRPSGWSRAFRVLLAAACTCALAYHMQRAQTQSGIGAARGVYVLTALLVVAGCAVGSGAKTPASAVALDVLVGFMPLLLLLTRPHNHTLFALFAAIFALFFSNPSQPSNKSSIGHPLRPSRALVLQALAHASFFALGNSNSLASVDLSNAYAGVSQYSEAMVGILVFISTWAGPLWWAMAGAAALMLNAGPSRSNLLLRVRALVVGAHLWQALMLLSLSCVATAMRSHLFVWSVFSPRYLYQIAWFAGFYLACGTIIGFIWLAAIMRFQLHSSFTPAMHV